MSIWDDDSDEWRVLMGKLYRRMSHTDRLMMDKRAERMLTGEAVVSQQELYAAAILDQQEQKEYR